MPADLLAVVPAGYLEVFQPELSVEPAGSCLVSPVTKAPVIPPSRVAEPVPWEGLVVPVLTSASGSGLLKFQAAMVVAQRCTGVAKRATPTNRACFIVERVLSFPVRLNLEERR